MIMGDLFLTTDSTLPVIFLVICELTALFKYLKREDTTFELPDKHARNVYNDVIRCEVPPPNLNSAKIFLCSVWGQTAKFKDRQCFQLYGR